MSNGQTVSKRGVPLDTMLRVGPAQAILASGARKTREDPIMGNAAVADELELSELELSELDLSELEVFEIDLSEGEPEDEDDEDLDEDDEDDEDEDEEDEPEPEDMPVG